YRVYSNLYLFRVSGLTYSPGWAVGYFFIPIISLFRPYQALQEVWRASDPDVPADDRRGWRDTDSSPVILLWWLLWIAGGILAQVYLRMALSGRAEQAGRYHQRRSFDGRGGVRHSDDLPAAESANAQIPAGPGPPVRSSYGGR